MSTRNSRGLAMTLVILSAILAILISVPVVEHVSTNAEEQYRDSWTKVQENFLFEDRLDDWDKHKDPPGNLKTMDDAHQAIDTMLKGLNDKYTRYYTAPQNVTRKQRAVKVNVVSWQMLPDNVGYIKITTFSSENTAKEVEKAMEALNKAGAKGYVIDLRNNGGGLVNQAFSTFALFNDKGEYESHHGRKDGKTFTDRSVLTETAMVEYTDGRISESRSRPANLSGDKPVTILVNGNTASASEAFAGAMRYHRKAILVGSQTFGKGIMQRTYGLDGGTAIKITVAYIFQPDGNCIHGVGMTPDQEIVKSKKTDNQMTEAVDIIVDKINSVH